MTYTAPSVHVIGSIESLTRASFSNNLKDSIFFNGVVVGSAQGSLDACVSTDPKKPTGTCAFK